MLFYITLSVCLSIVLSIPSEFYDLQPTEEVKKCFLAHSEEVMNCSLSFAEGIKLVAEAHMDILKTNPEAAPEYVKKIICCGENLMYSCTIKAIKPTFGCQTIFEEFVKNSETQVPEHGISNAQFCVKYPRGSKVCDEV